MAVEVLVGSNGAVVVATDEDLADEPLQVHYCAERQELSVLAADRNGGPQPLRVGVHPDFEPLVRGRNEVHFARFRGDTLTAMSLLPLVRVSLSHAA